jgi:hypothetical protein
VRSVEIDRFNAQQFNDIQPMLAVHLENLLFLLLLVVAGLFQLLGRVARKANTDEAERTSKPPPRTRKPIPRGTPQSDQERIRKLFEALGQPSASPQPRPAPNRPTYRKPLVLPRIPPLASPLPPLTTRPPEVPRETQIPVGTAPLPSQPPQTPLARPLFQVTETEAPPELIPVVAAAPVPQVRIQPQIALARSSINVTTLLRSSLGLRDAVIVREILGPPRGLQAHEIGT